MVTSNSGVKTENVASVASSYNTILGLGVGAFPLLLRIVVCLLAFVVMCKVGEL